MSSQQVKNQYKANKPHVQYRVQLQKRIQINKSFNERRNRAVAMRILSYGLFGKKRYQNLYLTCSLNCFYYALKIANSVHQRVIGLAMIIKFQTVTVLEHYTEQFEGKKFANKQYSKIVIKLTKNPTEEDKKQPGFNRGLTEEQITQPLTEVMQRKNNPNNHQKYNNQRKNNDRRGTERNNNHRYRQNRDNKDNKVKRDNRGYQNNHENRQNRQPQQHKNNYRQQKHEKFQQDKRNKKIQHQGENRQYERGQRRTRGNNNRNNQGNNNITNQGNNQRKNYEEKRQKNSNDNNRNIYNADRNKNNDRQRGQRRPQRKNNKYSDSDD